MKKARQLCFEGGIVQPFRLSSVFISLQARKRTQNIPQPFPAMKFTLIKKETKNIF